MAVTTIQYGQCGNQVGYEWYCSLEKDIVAGYQTPLVDQNGNYEIESIDRWFFQTQNSELRPRAILVDTEQKVIREIYKKQLAAHSWKYNPQNVVAQKDGGSGNNWAYGYDCKGLQMEEMIMDCVRKETERSDRLSAIMNLLSSAGGTGSGVGSYIIQCLKDEYPTKTLVNVVVLPYQAGEISTQNYNSLLTLSKVYDISDMHIIFQNDHLHKMCSTLLKMKEISLRDLNSLIALKLSSVLQPVENNNTSCFLSDIASHLTSHPGLKFVTIKSTPHIPKTSVKFEANYKWRILFHHMKQMLRLCSLNEESVQDWEVKKPATTPSLPHSLMQYVCSVSNFLISRGPGTVESQDFVEFLDSSHYPKWVPCDSQVKHWHQDRRLLNMDKFAALVTNNSSIHIPLNCIVQNAWNVFSHKAYLHQYSKFNVKEEEFLEAFAKLESVIKLYKELH